MARQRFGSLFAFLLYSLVFPFVNSQALTNDQIDQVKTRLAEGARQSWELGTRAQALIEYDVPFYSVLNDTSLPPPQDGPAGQLSEVFSIVQDVVGNRSRSNDDIQGPQPFMQDGSAADPASLGVAVLLANWTGLSSSDGLDYAGAAQDQLNYLLNEVPRTSDGAISHRVSQVQLWSDFVYMVPPFLAYYGVLTDNQTLVREAYNQIKLYRDYLRDDGANGLWKHVLLGSSGNDEGHWSTGNAWAAAGMLRVLGTIQHSPFPKSFKNEQKDLQKWVTEIMDGMYPWLQPSGLFRNYADNNSTFEDASSTALLTSAVYRHSLLSGVHRHLPDAERSRQALSAPANSSNPPAPNNSNSSLVHFTSNMWLTPVVNPHSYGVQGRESPEGQAFVVEMQAAWRDWVNDGSKGANGALKTGGSPNAIAVAVAAILALRLW
ncbi:unnamed protein product [Somion occarium]|uniref:Glycoside hydrolase family 105 protein n=1 Tax=Somion occarium TaxID=3059160 RepID=A0ABP1D1L6_9APHY